MMSGNSSANNGGKGGTNMDTVRGDLIVLIYFSQPT